MAQQDLLLQASQFGPQLPQAFSTTALGASMPFPAKVNPANYHAAASLRLEQFHYASTNDWAKRRSLAKYQQYAITGPEHILFHACVRELSFMVQPEAISKEKLFLK